MRHAVRFVKEAGAEAVKVEGGERRMELIARLVEAEIPVMGHIGLTPQSLHALGGFRVQGKTAEAAEQVLRDARAVEAAGAFSIVLESMPRELAAQITRELRIPTIGIGAGPDCDGQILVLHDHDRPGSGHTPKFARRYANVGRRDFSRRRRICRGRARREFSIRRGVVSSFRRRRASGCWPSGAADWQVTLDHIGDAHDTGRNSHAVRVRRLGQRPDARTPARR